MSDWTRLLSTRRLGPTPGRTTSDSRREYEVDHDRVVFSRSFRRLQDKTQVHPLADNDHVRRRLTHSVEVGSVGRSLATSAAEHLVARGSLEVDPRDIGLLVQAACLAHDIGNPPFGHSGEEAIRDWFCSDRAVAMGVFDGVPDEHAADLRHFEGNAHGFRILSRLEYYAEAGGMRLTSACLGTFMKYPWTSEVARRMGTWKYGVYRTEDELFAELVDELGLVARDGGGYHRHPLVYVVEAADDLCYAIADLEDGVELGVLEFEQVETLLSRFIPDRSSYGQARDDSRRLEMLRSYALRHLLPAAAQTFADAEKGLLDGSFQTELLDAVDGGDAIREAQQLAKEKVFSHPRKVFTEIGAFETIGGLLEAFCEAVLDVRETPRGRRVPTGSQNLVRLMGGDAPNSAVPKYEALRRVTDYVAGMTDGYAARLYSQITGHL